MSNYDIQQMLTWAWRWGKGHREGGGWFTTQDIHNAEPEHLAYLVANEWLEEGTTQRGNKELVCYRITRLGNRYLGAGFEVLQWDTQESYPPSPGRGGAGGGVTTSDNPPSPTSAEKPIVKPGDRRYTTLIGIRNLALSTQNPDAASAALALLDMTHENVQRLKESDQLDEALQLYYDGINSVLADWSQTIGGLLDDLLNQAY